MELKENTASARAVGRWGKSLKKNMSVTETSRYLYLGWADVTACIIASMTRSGFSNPVLHDDTKYSLARSTYCRLKTCFRSLSNFSQMSKPVLIFRMLVARPKLPGWMMLTYEWKNKQTKKKSYIRSVSVTQSRLLLKSTVSRPSASFIWLTGRRAWNWKIGGIVFLFGPRATGFLTESRLMHQSVTAFVCGLVRSRGTFTPKLAISTLRQSANASSPLFDTLYAPMFRQLKKEKMLDM